MDYFKICEMLKEKCLYISTLEKELESLKVSFFFPFW